MDVPGSDHRQDGTGPKRDTPLSTHRLAAVLHGTPAGISDCLVSKSTKGYEGSKSKIPAI